MAAADDLERLNGGEAADLGRAGAWRKGGIERIDVEAEIDRPALDPRLDLAASAVPSADASIVLPG